jgi:hypothetical protein
MNEIIACKGDNHYKLPHLNKSVLVDDVGRIPRSINLSIEAEQVLEELNMFDIVIEEDDLV